jgi:hypothetical protein
MTSKTSILTISELVSYPSDQMSSSVIVVLRALINEASPTPTILPVAISSSKFPHRPLQSSFDIATISNCRLENASDKSGYTWSHQLFDLGDVLGHVVDDLAKVESQATVYIRTPAFDH